jgi:hypothetical protein
MTASRGRPPDRRRRRSEPAPSQAPRDSEAAAIVAGAADSGEPSLWADWSVDVDQLDSGDEQDAKPAGQLKAHSASPPLPTERHKQLLMVLDGRAKLDRHGRRTAFGYEERLGASIGLKKRRTQQLIADLRTPERDPRHPNVEPAGLRLGLLKVEPSRRPDPDRPGRSLYGINRYILLFPQGAVATMQVQSAPPRKRVSSGQLKAQPDQGALHNEETPASEEREVITHPVTTAPRARGRPGRSPSTARCRAAGADDLQRAARGPGPARRRPRAT